jgi:type II secretory pathway component PulK
MKSLPMPQNDVRRNRAAHRQQGIALALVLILIVLMVTAVYTFSRRAVINVTIAQNRSDAAEADALARGGIRLAEAMLYWIRLEEQAGGSQSGVPEDLRKAQEALSASSALGEGDPWERLENFPIEFESGAELRLSIEEVGARLNLNALIAPSRSGGGGGADDSSDSGATQAEMDEAVEYLVLVLRHIIAGIDAPPEDKNYDERAIAENLIDYLDADDTAQSGRNEDDYYQRQEPSYRARNGPFVTFEEIGLVEGVDPLLLTALRDYVTVHPIGSRAGIDLNRAPPWVLPLVYAGPSGDRELLPERDVRRILSLRAKGKLLCTDSAADPGRCVSLSEAGLDEGSVYPELVLPLPVSVFKVVSEVRVGTLRRRLEAVIDTRRTSGPQMLSFRRLRGTE